MVRGIHPNGELNYIGRYNAGIPCGITWTSVKGGGWVVGCVDSHGQHTGEVSIFNQDNRMIIDIKGKKLLSFILILQRHYSENFKMEC